MAKTKSNFLDVLQDVAAQIRHLNLPKLRTSEVKVRRMPHDGERVFFGITVHPVTERMGVGVNDRDDIGYGAAVTMVRNNNNNSIEDMELILTWRETIRHHFIENACIQGFDYVFNVKVEHGKVFDDRLGMRENYDISTLVLRCYIREHREPLS